MGIEIKKGNYVSRIWFYHGDDDAPFDVMAHLWRQLPDGEWKYEYRFRYYVDNKAHGSADRKSAYLMTFHKVMTEAEVLEHMQPALAGMLALMPDGFSVEELVIESDEPSLVMHLLGKLPHMHMCFEEPSS